MPIVLSPNVPLHTLDLYYVEQKTPAGAVYFSFIKSPEDMEKWSNKGYVTEREARDRTTEANSPKRIESRSLTEKNTFDPEKLIYILRVEVKRMTWRDQNTIFSRALKIFNDPDGRTRSELDGLLYRELKLKTVVKRWNLTNERGEQAPVTDEAIDSLPGEVATEILEAYERLIEPSLEDLKN